MFAFTRFSLARQFMLVSLLILLAGMTIIGAWVSFQIERGVLSHTAAITALYMDSFVSPHLQSLMDANRLPEKDLAELDRLLQDTSLGQQIVSFKVWSPTGRILYSPSPDLMGRQFGIEGDLAQALDGEVTSEISHLNRPEHEYERQLWSELIETYAPVRATGSEEVIAVSEFYQMPDDLKAEIRMAQFRSWLVVGAATLIMYFLLAGMVGRASNTILTQRENLQNQLTQVRELLSQNQHLHTRVRRAAARTTALNEQFLRRISADLHDGPGQDLALAAMRIEPLCEDFVNGTQPGMMVQVEAEDLCITHTSLTSALKELRVISGGLRLPQLINLPPADVARRATRAYRRKTKRTVTLQVDDAPETAPIPVKITLYRVLQEALVNAFHHAGDAEQRVKLWGEDGRLHIEIADNGTGFDLQSAARDGSLGLVGMRERVELLGGTFTVKTAPNQGTHLCVMIPLEEVATASPTPTNTAVYTNSESEFKILS